MGEKYTSWLEQHSPRQDTHIMRRTENIKGAAVSFYFLFFLILFYYVNHAHSAIPFLNEAHVITCTYSLYTRGLWLKVSLFLKTQKSRRKAREIVQTHING